MKQALHTVSILLVVGAFGVSSVRAFVRTTFSNGAAIFWPSAQATLHLQLGCPPAPLPYWGPCWEDAALDAAARWNGTATLFRFSAQSSGVPTDPCSRVDGLNTVTFSPTLCGMSFGNALAVTISRGTASGALIDADVLFDAGRTWSTYPGELQFSAVDFHRVALHEFGHVLGLAHPDEAGQNVVAIMNSRISNIDDLQSDDIAGVNAIYPTLAPAVGTLENPPPGAFVSGIGLISGWVCAANRVDLQIDGALVQAAHGLPRADTRRTCGDDNNGFGFLLNWNLLGSGRHTVVALRDGVEFARATFTVTTLGEEFLRGASGRYTLPFAGRNVTVEWQESAQNFMIIGVE
jgi:hypothetical protein